MYARIVKKTTSSAGDESFKILSGETVLYTSPSLVNNQERSLDVCLPATTNNVYTLHMYDKTVTSWSDGAWIIIYGVNGNRVLRTIMIEKMNEYNQFSLNYPINKNEAWKYESSEHAGWKDASFNDANWTEMTLGATTTQASGTQYFRKSFTGLNTMAAIELQLKYSHGVVAYINGKEIYRDNMPTGEVTSATLATGSYTASDYRGVIRPSHEAEETQSVLSVELHFFADHHDQIDFNAFLYFGVGIMENNNCFIVPHDVTTTGNAFTNPFKAFDGTRNTGTTISSVRLPSNLYGVFFSDVVPMINAVRIWPYSNINNSPSAFSVSGGASASATSWTEIVHPESILYTANAWKQFVRAADPVPSPAVRVTIESAPGTTMTLYEMQFLVCNMLTQSITYPETSYSFNAKYSSVDIKPNIFGVSNCRTSPALPNGVHINPNTCAIYGSSTAGSPETTYTVLAQAGSVTASGTITLTFTSCEGSMIRILRTYKYSASTESFHIRNTDTDEMIFNVPPNHNNPSAKDKEDYLCLTADRYDVSIIGTGRTWYEKSNLYIYSLLPEGEEEMVLMAHYDSNQNNEMHYYLRRHSISSVEQWHYKMGEVPANWYSESMDSWSQNARGSFPESTNQIQLYKKTFTVANITQVSGVVLSIRYKYGCIVYLNGHEAWRNGVSGTLSASSIATQSYDELLYRVVTLPGRSIPENPNDAPVDFIQQGVNTIAIAIIAQNSNQKESMFDATVRLMSDEAESHIWELTGSVTAISGSATNPFDLQWGTTISYTRKAANSLTIRLNNDRREWVSSVQIQNSYLNMGGCVKSFSLYGRNSDDEEWMLLRNVTGITYTMKAQKRRIYFKNPVAYNQFKFENFESNEGAWKVQSLNLFADNTLRSEGTLAYPTENHAQVNIELAEIIPEGVGFGDYEVNPDLPEGLTIDKTTGWITGTPRALTPMRQYTITAIKFTGVAAQAVINLDVNYCTGTSGLMTVRIRADSMESENSWKLFKGRGTTGQVLRYVDRFPVKSTYYYLDFCLPNDLYTFLARDSYGDGWEEQSGYTLTVDMGALELEIEQLYDDGYDPVVVTTVFSTYFPFQTEYVDWKVSQSSVSADWNLPSYDDSEWSEMKAADIPPTESVTTYIRKSFTISSLEDYHVLNVRMKYSGGVVVYLNGNRVARFNLIADYDADTESMTVHDPTLFSKFHVILTASGAVEGENVMGFEVHRPVGTSSSEGVVFDATGVFGVETCSTVVDTYSSLTSTEPTSGTVEDMMDLDPYTICTLPNKIGTFVQWTVENLEGSKWNSFNLMMSTDIRSWIFKVEGWFDKQSNSIPLYTHDGTTIFSRTKRQLKAPVALASFQSFRWQIMDASTISPVISSMNVAYCMATGKVCPGIGLYPSVSEGQISPSVCPADYIGYSYRNCTNGVLGDIQTENCKPMAPTGIRYKSSAFTFVVGTDVATGVPTYQHIITRWYVDKALPRGLNLDEKTGEIWGRPEREVNSTTIMVYGENESGAAVVGLEVRIRKGMCAAEDVYPVTQVDETYVYACSQAGSYVGKKTRKCVLGEKDGVWEAASGSCVSIAAVVITVVVVVIVVVVIVLLAVKAGKKKKPVKGKKAAKV